MKSGIAWLVPFCAIATAAWADAQKSATITQKNSRCVVERAAGEYPTYRVLIAGKPAFSPRSAGIVAALISPSGRYVALSAGETGLIDVEAGKFEFGVVVVNCETGARKGYRKGVPTLITRWDGNLGLGISDYLNLSGNSGETLP